MKAEMLHVKEREPEGEGDVALPEVTTTLKAFKDRFGIYGTVDYSGAKPYEDYSDNPEVDALLVDSGTPERDWAQVKRQILNLKLPPAARNETTMDELADALRSTFVLRTLTHGERKALCRVAELVECKKGENLFVRGQVSNKFYYVLAGELQLLVGDEPKTADGLKRSNLRMVRGHGFGELALTDTNSARLADAVGAAETSCLLSLRRDQYEMALKATRAEIILTRLKKPAEERTPEDLEHILRVVLQPVEFFKSFSPGALLALSKLITLESWPEASSIFQRGDEADALYFCITATVEPVKSNAKVTRNRERRKSVLLSHVVRPEEPELRHVADVVVAAVAKDDANHPDAAAAHASTLPLRLPSHPQTPRMASGGEGGVATAAKQPAGSDLHAASMLMLSTRQGTTSNMHSMRSLSGLGSNPSTPKNAAHGPHGPHGPHTPKSAANRAMLLARAKSKPHMTHHQPTSDPASPGAALPVSPEAGASGALGHESHGLHGLGHFPHAHSFKLPPAPPLPPDPEANEPGEQPMKVPKYGPGALFGELCIYKQLRTRNMSVVKPGLLAKLRRDDMMAALTEHESKDAESKMAACAAALLLDDPGLSVESVGRITGCFASRQVTAGQELGVQGQPVESLWILPGRYSVLLEVDVARSHRFLRNEDDWGRFKPKSPPKPKPRTLNLSSVASGECVGLMEVLVNGGVWMSTYRADEPCSALVAPRSKLLPLLKHLTSIMALHRQIASETLRSRNAQILHGLSLLQLQGLEPAPTETALLALLEPPPQPKPERPPPGKEPPRSLSILPHLTFPNPRQNPTRSSVAFCLAEVTSIVQHRQAAAQPPSSKPARHPSSRPSLPLTARQRKPQPPAPYPGLPSWLSPRAPMGFAGSAVAMGMQGARIEGIGWDVGARGWTGRGWGGGREEMRGGTMRSALATARQATQGGGDWAGGGGTKDRVASREDGKRLQWTGERLAFEEEEQVQEGREERRLSLTKQRSAEAEASMNWTRVYNK